MTSSGPPRDETSPGIPQARSIPAADWKERLLLALGRRLRFRVSGLSMHPVLRPGDVVVVRPQSDFSVGDVVLAKHPYRKDVRILKCVSSVDVSGRAFLVGTNPAESTDSRTLGLFEASSVLGRVTSRLNPR